jgi:hypothetical protein
MRHLTKRKPGTAKLAKIAMTASGVFTTVHHPDRARITRKLGETFIVSRRLELSSDLTVTFDRSPLSIVSFYPGFLCHISVSFGFLNQAACAFLSRKGMPSSFKSSRASSLVFAVVTIVMSMPWVRVTLSNSISGKIVWSAMPRE